jgi:hypothetical protein
MGQVARLWMKRLLILVLISSYAAASTAYDRRYIGVWYGEHAYSGQQDGLPYNKVR